MVISNKFLSWIGVIIAWVSLFISGISGYYAFNANKLSETANNTSREANVISMKAFETSIKPIVTIESIDQKNGVVTLKNISQGPALHVWGFLQFGKDNGGTVRFIKNSDQALSGNSSYELRIVTLVGATPQLIEAVSLPLHGDFCLEYESMDGKKFITTGKIAGSDIWFKKYMEGSCNNL